MQKESCPHCHKECYVGIINRSKILFEDQYLRIFHSKARCVERQNKSEIDIRFEKIESDLKIIKEKIGL